MKADMAVSIIIRTLNEEQYLPDCLDSIKRQAADFLFDIIVVDTGSMDHTVRIAKSFGCKVIHINKEYFSYGLALNKGIEVAHGRVVVVLSAHCVPKNPHWLSQLVNPILSGECTLTSGTQESDPHARSSEVNYFQEKSARRDAQAFNNANSAFLKSLWKLRPFDEKLLAQEDIDFAVWHCNNGALFKFVPVATVIHYHNFTNMQLYRKLLYELKAEIGLGTKSMKDVFMNFLHHPLRIKEDLKLAYRRKKLLKASPGIIKFRLIEVIVYIPAFFSILFRMNRKDDKPI